MAMPVGNAIEHDASARATAVRSAMLCTNSMSGGTQTDTAGGYFPKGQLGLDATSMDGLGCRGLQDILQLWAADRGLLGKPPPGVLG